MSILRALHWVCCGPRKCGRPDNRSQGQRNILQELSLSKGTTLKALVQKLDSHHQEFQECFWSEPQRDLHFLGPEKVQQALKKVGIVQ